MFCTTCQIDKPTDDFRRDKTRKSGYQMWCKPCSSELNKRSYRATKPARIRYNLDRVKGTKQQLAVIRQYIGCVCCSEQHIACLDFHHINSSTKELAIAKSGHYSWARLQEELLKCACVCSNCHRKIHAGESLPGLSLITKEQIHNALKEEPDDD